MESFPFSPGQFVSAVAEDPNGKQQTRAYSIASAANGNRFELCVNRVENGFFSNHLADLPDLPVGGTIQIHGPHGHFILRSPSPTPSFIATGTGIAPMRGFTQWLFPGGPAPTAATARRSGSSTAPATKPTSTTRKSSRRSPAQAQLPLPAHAEPRPGELDRPARLRAGARRQNRRGARRPPRPPAAPASGRSDNSAQAELSFDIYTYICGLNFMVSACANARRLRLAQKAIVFERYD
jgi:hypothetical protein